MQGIKHSSNGGAVPGKGGEGTWNTYHQSVRKVSALVYIRQYFFKTWYVFSSVPGMLGIEKAQSLSKECLVYVGRED